MGFGLVKRSFKRTECEWRGHLINKKAENELFDNDKMEVSTICERCGAPLILVAQEDETYIVKERIF